VADASSFESPLLSTLVADTVFMPLVDLSEGTYSWRVATASPPSGYTLTDRFTITATGVRMPKNPAGASSAPAGPELAGRASAPRLVLRGAGSRAVTVAVHAADGRRVFRASYRGSGHTTVQPVPPLSPGVYFVGTAEPGHVVTGYRRFVLR
jgi:hypothetical protein